MWTALLLLGAASPIAAQGSSALVGIYDGGQTELAVGLELRADGRFGFGLSYGALDEEAAGGWTVEGNRVLLTSDPLTVPRFELLAQTPADRLQITLVPSGQFSPQYFTLGLRLQDGREVREQLSGDETDLPVATDNPPVEVRLCLQVFGVCSHPVLLNHERGYALRFRFEPNDLGKVAFTRKPLVLEMGDLLLQHQGVSIRLRRVRPRAN